MLEGAAVRERGSALFHGHVEADILVRPRNTEQVSDDTQTLPLARPDRRHARRSHRAGAGRRRGAARDIVLSLESMNAIERVDVAGRSLRAQAGVQLGRVQRAAEEHGMVFPLDLGARDSATVGGNISTNAGGLRVLRYGMMRNLVLGIEAVLADGTVLTSLNRMLKNNAGYDLKQLFIGSEGTLGVVTRAELRLVSRTRSQETLLASLPSFDAMVELLGRLDSGTRRPARGLRSAVGQLLRLQHRAAGAERGAAAARRAVLRHRRIAGRRSGGRPGAARSGARRGHRGGRGQRRRHREFGERAARDLGDPRGCLAGAEHRGHC